MAEALVHDISWNIDYKFHLGSTWSRFLVSLRDDKTILGTTCKACERTYVPPQAYCESCYESIDTWTEVAPTGTLHTATVTMKSFEGGPTAPYCVAAIRLDGTDTLFIHHVGGFDLTNPQEVDANLRMGTRVEAVWAENRRGTILDIAYFRPIVG
jgi:uncharacterized OB-fold protein